MVQNKLIFQKYYFMKKFKRLHTYNRSVNSIIIIPVIAFSSRQNGSTFIWVAGHSEKMIFNYVSEFEVN